MMHIFRAVAPFLLISIAVLILVFFVPALANWLPNLI
jgi:TRAP-type C4-dicarboxylate transport system permease large subunit